ncbi:MAG: hypothetical protein KGH93_00860 [Patescibacteria group bacterium]|nr:hypothetical protein [Patescibacteria group bacterium]MDE1945730.1 hypothetical protein [Patescibacteria group bacterium]
MDENSVPQQNVDEKLRETVAKELGAFTNPKGIGNPPPAPSSTDIRSNVPPTAMPAPAAPKPAAHPAQPIIRTYKSDMEETIEAGHLSSINIAASEQGRMMRRSGQGILEERKPAGSKSILMVVFLLLLGGAAAIAVPYFLVKKQTAPAVATSTVASETAVMPVDNEEDINTASVNLSGIDSTLESRVTQSSIPLGQVKDFVLVSGAGSTTTPISASQFLSLVGANVPAGISRNLLPNYMFGMYEYNGSQEFLILQVSDYDTAFAGMLSWEGNGLWDNFKNLFGLPDVGAQNASSTPSATAISTVNFQDAQYSNQNVRVVKNDAGAVVFLYSIINQNTIVMATSPDTLREIVSRIASARTVTQ